MEFCQNLLKIIVWNIGDPSARNGKSSRCKCVNMIANHPTVNLDFMGFLVTTLLFSCNGKAIYMSFQVIFPGYNHNRAKFGELRSIHVFWEITPVDLPHFWRGLYRNVLGKFGFLPSGFFVLTNSILFFIFYVIKDLLKGRFYKRTRRQ